MFPIIIWTIYQIFYHISFYYISFQLLTDLFFILFALNFSE